MNTKIISAIAFKVFAIYVVVAAIIALPQVAGVITALYDTPLKEETQYTWPTLIVLSTIILVFISFKILWKLGNSTIENINIIDVEDKETEWKGFEKTVFTCLGLYFAISALVWFPNLMVTLWVQSNTPDGITYSNYASLVSFLAQMLIGLSLIAKVDKWILFFRNIGVK